MIGTNEKFCSVQWELRPTQPHTLFNSVAFATELHFCFGYSYYWMQIGTTLRQRLLCPSDWIYKPPRHTTTFVVAIFYIKRVFIKKVIVKKKSQNHNKTLTTHCYHLFHAAHTTHIAGNPRITTNQPKHPESHAIWPCHSVGILYVVASTAPIPTS